MSSGDWTWKFTPRAADRFEDLDPHVQDRVVSKLDEVVESGWRDPDEFLEPLTGGPFSKLRVGQYRLACVLDRDASVLEVHRIEHRSGATPPRTDRSHLAGLNHQPPHRPGMSEATKVVVGTVAIAALLSLLLVAQSVLA